jgi:hypothetical protein
LTVKSLNLRYSVTSLLKLFKEQGKINCLLYTCLGVCCKLNITSRFNIINGFFHFPSNFDFIPVQFEINGYLPEYLFFSKLARDFFNFLFYSFGQEG